MTEEEAYESAQKIAEQTLKLLQDNKVEEKDQFNATGTMLSNIIPQFWNTIRDEPNAMELKKAFAKGLQDYGIKSMEKGAALNEFIGLVDGDAPIPQLVGEPYGMKCGTWISYGCPKCRTNHSDNGDMFCCVLYKNTDENTGECEVKIIIYPNADNDAHRVEILMNAIRNLAASAIKKNIADEQEYNIFMSIVEEVKKYYKISPEEDMDEEA